MPDEPEIAVAQTDPIPSEDNLPSLQDYEDLRNDLQGIGIPAAAVDKFPTALVVHLIRQRQLVQQLRDRLRDKDEQVTNLEFDITRLRGQRDALRMTLLRQNQEDPMKGYASEHTLATITEVIRREERKKSDT